MRDCVTVVEGDGETDAAGDGAEVPLADLVTTEY